MPLCEIGRDFEETFISYFGENELIDTSAIKKTSLPNVVNRLEYDESGKREEWNSRIPERLSLAAAGDEVDAVLVNFISGDDIAAEDLAEFRKRFSGIIYCDYHSLALGRGGDGKRYFRKHPEYEKFIAPAGIIQMNIAELATISGVENLSFGNIIAVCSLIHGLGPDICIVTLGPNGAVISLEGGKSAYHQPPIPLAAEVDPTGCGDTFAAVFLYKFLVTGNPLDSVATANRYAAAKATFAGIDGFRSIDSILETLGPGADPVKIK